MQISKVFHRFYVGWRRIKYQIFLLLLIWLLLLLLRFFWKFCMAKDDLFRHMHDYGVTIDEEMTITSKKKMNKDIDLWMSWFF